MGNTCCSRKKAEPKIVLLLLGLDNAGKTVAAKGLAGEPLDTVVPTVGFSVISLPFRSYTVKVFDLGGGSDIREIWPQYFVDAHGVIFVIDSSDVSRMEEVKEVLHNLLSNEKIAGKPVLVLANKQDVDYALDEIDLVEKLDLENLVNENHCPTLVETCSATEVAAKSKVDAGIKRGYHWLVNYIVREYEHLNKRVEQDVRTQEILEHHLLQEKILKLQKARELQKKLSEEDKIESYADYTKKLNGTTEPPEQTTTLDSSHASSSTDKTENSLPSVHYSLQEEAKRRPKSATHIIKRHLELEGVHRSSAIRLATNKTAPINGYGLRLPRSAEEKRSTFARKGRNLRSAGDGVIVGGDMPRFVSVGVEEGNLHRQLYELNHFGKGGRGGNEVTVVHRGGGNGNAVGDVDVD